MIPVFKVSSTRKAQKTKSRMPKWWEKMEEVAGEWVRWITNGMTRKGKGRRNTTAGKTQMHILFNSVEPWESLSFDKFNFSYHWGRDSWDTWKFIDNEFPLPHFKHLQYLKPFILAVNKS